MDLRSKRVRLAKTRGSHTWEEWAFLVRFCGGRCVKCGVQAEALVPDHILPVSRRGSDSILNLQPMCVSCNTTKGPSTFDYRPDGWKAAMEAALEAGWKPEDYLFEPGGYLHTEGQQKAFEDKASAIITSRLPSRAKLLWMALEIRAGAAGICSAYLSSLSLELSLSEDSIVRAISDLVTAKIISRVSEAGPKPSLFILHGGQP